MKTNQQEKGSKIIKLMLVFSVWLNILVLTTKWKFNKPNKINTQLFWISVEGRMIYLIAFPIFLAISILLVLGSFR